MGVILAKDQFFALLFFIGFAFPAEAFEHTSANPELLEKLHLTNEQSEASTGVPENCTSVNWSDQNCVLGPVAVGSNIAPTVFKQLCPKPRGNFEAPASCDLYVVCHDDSLTVNRCPETFHFNPSQKSCMASEEYACSHPIGKHPNSVFTTTGALIREKRIARSLLSDDSTLMSPASKALESHRIEKRSPCKENYIEPHPRFCSKFLICSNGKTTEQECGPGSVFDPLSGICDSAENVDCQSRMSDFGTYGCQKGSSYRTSHPEFCNKFVECEQGRIHIKTCSFNTVFNPETNACDHKNKYKCKELISLEHDTDINYLPSTIARGRESRDLSKYVCEFNYIAPLEGVCNEFIECENKQIFRKSCGPGTAYNVLLGQCDWPYNVRVPDAQYCGRYLQCDGRNYVPKSCPQNWFFNAGTGKCDGIENVSCAGKRDDPRATRPTTRPPFVGLQS